VTSIGFSTRRDVRLGDAEAARRAAFTRAEQELRCTQRAVERLSPVQTRGRSSLRQVMRKRREQLCSSFRRVVACLSSFMKCTECRLCPHRALDERNVAGDQAGAGMVSEVGPEPFERYDHSIAHP